MNTSIEQVLDCMCRTCMHKLVEEFSNDVNNKPEQQWRYIFNKTEGNESLSIIELIDSAVPQMDMQPSDELPKKMCFKCVEQLHTIYRFQQMCVQSDQQIRQLITNGNVDLKVTITDAVVRNKIRTNDISAPETVQEEIEEQTSQSRSADPLQSVEEARDQVDVGHYVKNEPTYDYASNGEYSGVETLFSPCTIKNERIITVETEMEQTCLPILPTNICTPCNKSFADTRHVNSHLKRRKGWDEPIGQGEALLTLTTTTWDEKNEKQTKQLDYSSLECDICHSHFHKEESLHKHRLDHKEQVESNQIICTRERCDKSYNTRFILAQHKRMKHYTEEPQKKSKNKSTGKPKKRANQYVCDICSKNFTNSAKLKEHLNTHTGERPFLCPECGKSFSKESYLRQHLLRHGAADAFECPLCPRKFRCMNDISKHKVIHLQNKKHICDVCGDGFIKPHQLTAHKRYHNPVKPYKCDYCDMRFVSKYNNRSHMRTHTGEKPWKCKYCDRQFARSSDLMQHLRIHVGKNVYRCELCPSTFRLASELRVHIVIHKNEDEDTRARNMKALKEEETKLKLKLEKEKPQQNIEIDL